MLVHINQSLFLHQIIRLLLTKSYKIFGTINYYISEYILENMHTILFSIFARIL